MYNPLISIPLNTVSFSNGQLIPSAANEPKFTLYHKTKDRTKKKRVIVSPSLHICLNWS